MIKMIGLSYHDDQQMSDVMTHTVAKNNLQVQTSNNPLNDCLLMTSLSLVWRSELRQTD